MTEGNGGMIDSVEKLMRMAKASAILGTLQAGYTNFRYVTDATRRITEREALLGASITGWMNNPDILFNEDNLKAATTEIKRVNREIAAMLGIRPAARTTAVKPSGNASTLLGCASGIHGDHSPRYFRNVQLNVDTEVCKLIAKVNPAMVEKSVWNANGTDVVVSYPIVAKEGSKFKSDLLGVKQLEYVKQAQLQWVMGGTDKELCVDPRMTHNVSNTITVDDWDAVEQYIFDNRNYFSGVSLLASAGDKAYAQAPFTEVHTPEQMLEMYGVAAFFASGLIVDGRHAFDNNLWMACDTAMGMGLTLDENNSDHLLKRDWVRRAHKFAKTYFNGDMAKMTFCLKDAHNLHKWESITRSIKDIDFADSLQEVKYTQVDTLAAAGCAGGACEVSFT